MGQVQHYFATKTDMPLFALGHMRDRVLARLGGHLAAFPQPVTVRDHIRAAMRVMLPVDEPGRQEAALNYAFFAAARATPQFAALLRQGDTSQFAYARAELIAAADDSLLRDGIDPGHEAVALYFLVHGLAPPLLIGQLTPDEALGLLDHQLARIFR